MISESTAFHTAIFDALCACLGLNKTSAAAISLIHEAYAEPENVPRPPRNRNVIYWTILQDLSPDPVSTEYNAGETPRAASGGNSVGGEVNRSERAPLRGVATTEVAGAGTHIPIICTTLKYQLVIVCYGPACEEYASRIRSMLYLDGSGFPRKILRDAGIYPVPDPPQPALLHEDEGSLWRKRADLTIQIRVRDEQRGQSRGSISTAVEVILH